MNFSTDQVRNFYVALSKAASFDSATPSGAIQIKSGDEDIFFTYMSPNGDYGNAGVVRSDLINKNKIEYAVATKPKSRPLQRKVVSFDPSINGGAPIVGQEYIIRFVFYGLGVGGNENQYLKLGGAYKARQGDTAKSVMKYLEDSIKKNFSREAYPYVKVTNPDDGTLIIEEVPQPWVIGKRQAAQIIFDIQTVPINVSNSSYPWGVVTDTTSTNTNVIKNGKEVADMEWFYYGERGDIYRGNAYPSNFETKYVADPNKEYSFIDIHYYYAGDAEDIQKSKKYITIAIPTDGSYAAADMVTDLTEAGVKVVNKL